MRAILLSLVMLGAVTQPAFAVEGEGGGLMSPSGGLMFWTIIIFLLLFFVLKRYAFGPITAAVEARERALEEAIEGAKRDREEAARLLAEQRTLLESARGEAQQLIAEGRSTADKVRVELLQQGKQQQQELMERARRDIANETTRAIAELRREAVDLAIAGASKVIEKNLDDASNRKLVEKFLESVVTTSADAR